MQKRVYMYPTGRAAVALYSYKLANALADQGLIVMQFIGGQYELDDLPAKFNKVRVLSNKYPGIRANQGRIPRVADVVGTHCYNSRKFYSYIKKDKPEIVHLQSFLFYPIEWYLLNRLQKISSRVILTVHNVMPFRFFTQRFTGLELAMLQYIYNVADKLIVHTEVNRQQLLAEFSVDERKVVVIPHGEYTLTGISQEISEDWVRSTLNLSQNQKVILFFGYIRKIKGLDVLLKAFDEAAESCDDVILIIAGSVGEGESFSEYRHIMSRMKHRSRVRLFIKYVEHDEIPIYFTIADIVVLPYVEFCAQSGVAHLAQGFGKAVIGTDVGGVPEAIENYRSGLIVPAGDVGSLAKAIVNLIENDGLRAEMGRRGREMALGKFSWQTIAKATIKKAYGL